MSCYWVICDHCKVKQATDIVYMTERDSTVEFIRKHINCEYLKGVRVEPREGYPSPHRSRDYEVEP